MVCINERQFLEYLDNMIKTLKNSNMKDFIKRYFDIGDRSSQNHINFYVGKKDSIV